MSTTDARERIAVGQVLGLIVGQYVLKLLIAVLDTPFVYAVVGLVRSHEHGRPV